MKKNIIQLGLLGFPLGIAIGFIISIIFSILIGDGLFYPVNPQLIKTAGDELSGVIIQTLLCGIIGSGFSIISIIWNIDSWSIAKQTGVYFSLACVIMFPISYMANWMPHSVKGILSYVGMFVTVFIFFWLIQYFIWKIKIKKMNEKIKTNGSSMF